MRESNKLLAILFTASSQLQFYLRFGKFVAFLMAKSNTRQIRLKYTHQQYFNNYKSTIL